MPATITNIAFKGYQLIVRLKCQEGHETEWKSQPNCNHYSVGNLATATSVLFSANTYQRLARFFDLAGIQWICRTSFYAIQNRYGIVNRNYIEKSKARLEDMKQAKSIDLSEYGRCDSPGHNAKYLTYSFTGKSTNKTGAFSLTQVTEAGNSNRMEKMGFEKALKWLKDEGIIPEQITTNRHILIRKYLKEKKQNITHEFDVWYFAKNIKKKLLAASKKSSCKILQKWIKSIGNHVWWSCATCEGDAQMLRERWINLLFHIQNKHKWTGHEKFQKCVHPLLTKKQVKAKEWLSPKSEAFEAVQNIVLDKKVLENLSYLTKFCHAEVLNIYISLYNERAPKRQHFSYLGILARSQLAIMDFNKESNLEQATTEKDEKRYNAQFSKITKSWSSKPIKKEKGRSYLHRMVKETVECVKKKERPEKPLVPDLPKNIVSSPKPDKSVVIENQRSHFGN